ncbi:hypothetical protein [Aeromonas phage ZPAH34]|uniref:hypothetical protein n=1 Tax=Aeromonas phage ZPAH34 TaxID=2924888 RepID=UPI0023294C51|nr:hypothetical protein PQD16_gp149 [Aeromonas phage ZPAH34]UOX39534.1 hypothetical protein [Aeromonas phage ZPAH34]
MSDVHFIRVSATRFVAHGYQDLNSFQSITLEDFKKILQQCGLKSNWGVWVEPNYIRNGDNVVIFELHEAPPLNRIGSHLTGEVIYITLPELPYKISIVEKQKSNEPGREGNVFFDRIGYGVYQLHNKENYFGEFIDEFTFNELIPEHLKDQGLYLYFDSDNGIESGLILASEQPYSKNGSFAQIDQKFKHVGGVIDYITNNSFLSDWLHNRLEPVVQEIEEVRTQEEIVQLCDEESYTIEEVKDIISFLRPDLDLESNLVKKLLAK